MKHKLNLGLKEGKLLKISEVESGLKCACVCSACHHPLVAKKGNLKVHHFAHYKSAECSTAIETALHLAAKEILAKHKKIKIPTVNLSIGDVYGDEYELYEAQMLTFDDVYVEKKLGAIVPDLIIEKNGKQLFIEIAVTHFIEEDKRLKIKALGVSTLEVDLSKVDREITLELLEDILINKTENKEWIFHAKVDSIQKQYITLVQKNARKITLKGKRFTDLYHSYCPKNQSNYANLTMDCHYCPYMLGEISDHVLGGRESVICAGDGKEELNSLLSRLLPKNAIKL